MYQRTHRIRGCSTLMAMPSITLGTRIGGPSSRTSGKIHLNRFLLLLLLWMFSLLLPSSFPFLSLYFSSALPGALTRPFDVTIYEYRRTRFMLSQRIIHKFIYIEYIQNWGVSGYSLSQLLTERPHTFLVHKKHECPECDPVTD